jgi:TnpA family transposase
MALSKKQSNMVAEVMVAELGRPKAVALMKRMNEAAYGKKPKKSLRSFRRITRALQASRLSRFANAV